MKFQLKRVKNDCYDEIVDTALKNFFGTIEETKQKVETESDFVLINGKKIDIDIDLDLYFGILEKYQKAEKRDIEIAKLLHKDFKNSSISIPDYILYEKEVWTYLNICVFFDIVSKRYPDIKDHKNEEAKNKIKNFYFCHNNTYDRTGLRWLWIFANVTYDDYYQYSLLETGREFIDPVKAIYECCIGRNKILFKAYIRAIELLNKDSRIRGTNGKTIVPKHIRNCALMNVYESYTDVETLANIIATSMLEIIKIAQL